MPWSIPYFFTLLDPAQGPDCHRSWGSSGETVKRSNSGARDGYLDLLVLSRLVWKLISWIEAPNSHRQNVSANLQLLFSDIPWPHVTAQPCSLPAFPVNTNQARKAIPKIREPRMMHPGTSRKNNSTQLQYKSQTPVRPPTGQGPCLGCLGGVVGSLIGGDQIGCLFRSVMDSPVWSICDPEMTFNGVYS